MTTTDGKGILDPIIHGMALCGHCGYALLPEEWHAFYRLGHCVNGSCRQFLISVPIQ